MGQINLGSTKIKKIYVGNTQVKKVYVGSNKVYSADVTLVNQVGDSRIRNTQQLDAGTTPSTTVNVKTFTTVSGHRYFVRAAASEAGSWTWGPTSNAQINGTTIASLGNTNNVILNVSSSTRRAQHNYSGSCVSGSYSAVYADFYMFVDITELEEALGTTFTAASFWSYIGSQVFYGTKTIEV